MQSLCGLDCLCGAGFCTGSAIGAFCCIDNIDRITLADRFYRALRETGSARKASIINFVGHNLTPLLMFVFSVEGWTT